MTTRCVFWCDFLHTLSLNRGSMSAGHTGFVWLQEDREDKVTGRQPAGQTRNCNQLQSEANSTKTTQPQGLCHLVLFTIIGLAYKIKKTKTNPHYFFHHDIFKQSEPSFPVRTERNWKMNHFTFFFFNSWFLGSSLCYTYRWNVIPIQIIICLLAFFWPNL